MRHAPRLRQVLVVGNRLSARAWSDRSSTLRTTLALTADTLTVLAALAGAGQETTCRQPTQASSVHRLRLASPTDNRPSRLVCC
ncbi:MAG: hypothetical protein M3220_05285 [Chloroflexota bacterium]|nr:hypothetical protein [Chloroflexota bacterium]